MATTSDCYSAIDRKLMNWWAHLRARTLGPLLQTLGKLGVTADGITIAALFLGLAFCPLIAHAPAIAVTCLWLHVLVDGLDGPLARFLGTASPRGSLTDTFCDQVVVAASAAALIHTGHLDGIVGALYIFSYTLVVAFAMIRNALTVPYPLVLRPRFIVYAWIIVDCFLWPNTLTYVVAILLIPLFIQAFQGFRAIRRKL